MVHHTWLGFIVQQPSSEIIGDAFGAVPIAAIIAPLFLGLITDRFFNCEKTMGVLHLIGGVLLLLAPSLIASGKGETLSWIILGTHALLYADACT